MAKYPRVQVNNKKEFEQRAIAWKLMLDILGDGSWAKVGEFLEVDKFIHGPRRVRKKKIARYIRRLSLKDILAHGEVERV